MEDLTATHSAPVVLYVEDHPVNAMLMAALFEMRPGLRLVVASSVADALAQAPQLDPVLLLLDIHLPDGNGRELLPRLREIPGCSMAPAVAVTAAPDFGLEDSGFAELWTKPLNLPSVLQRVDALTASIPVPEGMPAHAMQGRPQAHAAAAWS